MLCPICNSPQLETQPQPGTHAFTTKYECGYETITVLYTGEKIVEKQCHKKEEK